MAAFLTDVHTHSTYSPDGISTLEDKALGCTQKSGFAPVKDVLKYGQKVEKAGYEVFIKPKNVCVGGDEAFPARIAFCKGPLGEEIEFFCEGPDEAEALAGVVAVVKNNFGEKEE